MQARSHRSTPAPFGLRADEAAAFVGLGRTAFDELWKAQQAPQPAALRGRLRVWSVDELRAWMASGCPTLDDWRRIWAQMLKSGTWGAPLSVAVIGEDSNAARA